MSERAAVPNRGVVERIADILGMIKFSHTLFALPFALLSAVLAVRGQNRPASFSDWLGIVLCMIFARSAAMAFNRLVDQRIDAANPRTASRHLPSGQLDRRSVWLFCIASVIGFMASTSLFLPRNPWPVFLSIPILAWLLGYSYAKRFTAAAHFWLGVALALAPIGAWIAIRGALDWPPVLLGAAVVFWVAGFDILYACQDVEFDQRTGLHSIPARIGVPNALRVAALCHAIMIALLAALAVLLPMGWLFRTGLVAIAALLVVEHALVRPEDLSKVNLAFFRVNALISMALLALGVVDTLMAGGSA